jgi:hypothetical protein
MWMWCFWVSWRPIMIIRSRSSTARTCSARLYKRFPEKKHDPQSGHVPLPQAPLNRDLLCISTLIFIVRHFCTLVIICRAVWMCLTICRTPSMDASAAKPRLSSR